MNDTKYIGLDVHQATISVAVLDSAGKLVMEAVLETKAETILQFIHGLRGSLHVTLEEGTCAAWLHDVLKPHVARVLVCDPRKNALIKAGNKSDRIDARKLADLLYLNKLSPIYHFTSATTVTGKRLLLLCSALAAQELAVGFSMVMATPLINRCFPCLLQFSTWSVGRHGSETVNWVDVH